MQCVQKPTFHHSFSSFITYFHSSTAQISHINSTCNFSYKDVEERNYLNEKQILSKMYADTASRAITWLLLITYGKLSLSFLITQTLYMTVCCW